MAFIACIKAFDNVNRSKQCSTMEKMGYAPRNKQFIERNKKPPNYEWYNTAHYPQKGVKQGCPISKTLFNIYIDNIFKSNL